MRTNLKSGNLSQCLEVRDANLLAVLGDDDLISPAVSNPQAIIRRAIDNPIGMDRLDDLLSADSSVSIIVDDNTRPTPTREILEVLLERLQTCGVPTGRINITIATGFHRAPSYEEKQTILGSTTLDLYDVASNVPSAQGEFVRIGTTQRETPVFINRRVVDADLIIACGLIKSHSFAGFTGGAKSLIPGVAGRETILRNHRYEFVEYPNGILGDADRSIARLDAEEAVGMLPIFVVNVIKNVAGVVVDAVAGNLVRAHRSGVSIFMKMAEKRTEQQADIAIVEGGYSSQLQLYQALGSIDCVASTRFPVLREKGLVILFAECREGMGSHLFEEEFTGRRSPEAILHELERSPAREEQWAIQRLAFFLVHFRVSLVSSGLRNADLSRMNIETHETAQQALAWGLAHYGSDARVLVVRNPDFLVPTAIP